MGYQYGDENVDRLTTEFIANTLARWGLNDIRELAVKEITTHTLDCGDFDGDGNVVPSKVALRAYFFQNRKTGGQVSPNIHIDFVDNADYDIGFRSCAVSSTGNFSNGAYRFMAADDNTLENTVAGQIGDNVIRVWVKFTDTGIPYFFADLFNTRGMSFGQALQQLATIALAAATFVVPGVNAAIASTIFGPLATAYPALTAAASNVMINTALNGGDVETAVKNTVASYLGQSSGQLVSGLADSQVAGQLAAAAVSAAARGGDVEQAIATTALRLAPAAAVDLFSPAVQPITNTNPVYDSPTITPAVEPAMSIFDIPSSAPVLDDVDYSSFDFSPGGDFSGFDLYSYPLDMSGDPMFDSSALGPNLSSLDVPMTPGVLSPLESDPVSTFSGDSMSDVTNTFVPTSAPTFQTLSADESFSGPTEGSSIGSDDGSAFFGDVSFRDVVQGISDTAIALLRVNQAYQAAGRPSIQPATRTTVSGANQTVRADGTVVTTDPVTGAVAVNRAPVGVPYALPNGSVVTNNGDGTYTTISSSGARTSQYPPINSSAGNVFSPLTGSTIVSGVPNWAIIGGGAAALALLLKR